MVERSELVSDRDVERRCGKGCCFRASKGMSRQGHQGKPRAGSSKAPHFQKNPPIGSSQHRVGSEIRTSNLKTSKKFPKCLLQP